MVGNFYWNRHKQIDVALAVASTSALWLFGSSGHSYFTFDALLVQKLAATWVGPTLSLFGLFSATIAFMFTVIDKPEFTILRQSRAQAQLWQVFQGNLIWLCVAAVVCFGLATCNSSLINNKPVAILASFVSTMVIISLCKFTWVMTQVLSVRIAKAKRGSPE